MEQEPNKPELLHPFNPKQNQGGRPTKLTPAVAEQIAKYVGEGSFFETAAGAAGVSHDSMRLWLIKGQDAKAAGRLKDKYCVFYERLLLAQAEHEQRLVATLSRGGDGKYSDWRAQEVILSRRYKQRWAEERAPQPAAVTINIGVEAAAALADALAVATVVTDPLQTQTAKRQPKLLESLAAPSDSQSGSADPDKSSGS